MFILCFVMFVNFQLLSVGGRFMGVPSGDGRSPRIGNIEHCFALIDKWAWLEQKLIRY